MHYIVEFCTPPGTLGQKAKFLFKHPKSLITGKKLIRMEGVDQELIQSLAARTEGFSGRQIFKMVVAWHDAAFAKPDPVLTPEMMERILEETRERLTIQRENSFWQDKNIL